MGEPSIVRLRPVWMAFWIFLVAILGIQAVTATAQRGAGSALTSPPHTTSEDGTEYRYDGKRNARPTLLSASSPESASRKAPSLWQSLPLLPQTRLLLLGTTC